MVHEGKYFNGKQIDRKLGEVNDLHIQNPTV